jgi:ubiquinone/menaquinone biosynthesis C-methylase UbiE
MPARHVHAPVPDPEIDAIREEIATLSMHCHWHTPLFTQVILDCLTIEGVPRVVDIGCGNGELIRLLLERYPAATTHAIDTRRDHLDVSRGRLSAAASRVTYLEAALEDVTSWPELGSVTAMTMLNVLHFIDDELLEGILSELRRRLAPAGILFASVAAASPAPWRSTYTEIIRQATQRAWPGGERGERLAELVRRRTELTASGRWIANSSGFVSHSEQRLLQAFEHAGFQTVTTLVRMGEFVLIAGRQVGSSLGANPTHGDAQR